MKKTLITLLACLSTAAATAATTTATDSFSDLPCLSAKRASGSLTLGIDTQGNDRGVVLSHNVLSGNGSPFGVLKYNYDFGKEKYWSFDGMVYFRDQMSGHALYGNPSFPAQPTPTMLDKITDGIIAKAAAGGVTLSRPVAAGMAPGVYASDYAGKQIKRCNAEPQIVLQNGLKYTRDKWNVGMGYTFIHGGILGVMAKHFRERGMSKVAEVYLHPEVTPFQWLSMGCSVRYSVAGIPGWWFEPDVTVKAPLVKDGDKVKVAAVAKFAMTATADYFDNTDSACNNGSQAFYIKLSTPWFVNDSFIVTPGVGFHWLGKGALKCNERSSFRPLTGKQSDVPFQNFAVVGSLMATYKF